MVVAFQYAHVEQALGLLPFSSAVIVYHASIRIFYVQNAKSELYVIQTPCHHNVIMAIPTPTCKQTIQSRLKPPVETPLFNTGCAFAE